MSALSRWTETLKRLRPSQVGHRAVRRLRPDRPSGATSSAVWQGVPPLPPESRRPLAFPYDRPRTLGWSLAGHEAKWNDRYGLVWAHEATATLLARYHAGYAEWVRAMAETGDAAGAASLWAAAAPSMPSHPYVLSRGVLSLIEARIHGATVLDPLLRNDAARLAKSVEWDVRGNHLVANGAALYRFGHAFRGGNAKDARERGAAILAACAREQVLSDGVHYEKSPVYQGIVLEHLLVALETAAASGEPPPRGVEDAARRMAAALAEMVLPDGGLVRWRDGAPGMSLPTDALLRWADRRAGPVPAARTGPRTFPVAGLAILETPDGRSAAALFAAGPCPRDLPAHGHADALAYEAVLDGVRVVASAGTADYAEGPARVRDRLPGAFAGVRVHGHAPADPWASFRVGRRGWVRRLEAGTERETSFALATSDGFAATCRGTLHRRAITLAPGPHLAVVDEWTGRGERAVTLFFPMAPGLEVEVVEGGAIVSGAAGTFRLVAPGFTLEVEDGVFATGLGKTVPRHVIRASARVDVPGRLVHAWTVGREPVTVVATPVVAGEVRVDVVRAGARTSVFVPAGLSP